MLHTGYCTGELSIQISNSCMHHKAKTNARLKLFLLIDNLIYLVKQPKIFIIDTLEMDAKAQENPHDKEKRKIQCTSMDIMRAQGSYLFNTLRDNQKQDAECSTAVY